MRTREKLSLGGGWKKERGEREIEIEKEVDTEKIDKGKAGIFIEKSEKGKKSTGNNAREKACLCVSGCVRACEYMCVCACV